MRARASGRNKVAPVARLGIQCALATESPLQAGERTRRAGWRRSLAFGKPGQNATYELPSNPASISSSVLPFVSGKKNAAAIKYATVQPANRKNIDE